MSNRKITIIGNKAAGKTCYLASMYKKMNFGEKGFNVKEPDKDLYLSQLWAQITKGKIQDGDLIKEVVALTNQPESYNFTLLHNFKEVCRFDWLDYPGGALANNAHKNYETVKNSILNSSCLFVILDGAFFAGIKAKDEGEFIRNAKEEMRFNEDFEFRNIMSAISDIGIAGQFLPPIALIVTKTDMITHSNNSAYFNGDNLKQILFDVFPNIFNAGGNVGERQVIICAVSLGPEYEMGGKARPMNVEQPIAFAVLNILLGMRAAADEKLKSNQRYISNQCSGFGSSIRRWWNDSEIHASKDAIINMEALKCAIEDGALSLLSLFPDEMNLYLNGKPSSFKSTYKQLFS